MAKNKLNLHELSDKDLTEKMNVEKTRYKKLQFNHTVNQLENPKTLKTLRRDIARMKTEEKSRSLQAQAKTQAK